MPKRIIFPKQGRVVLEDFDPGEPGHGDLGVRTIYSLMSIGTETTILHRKYAPDTHFAQMFSFPQLQTGVQAVAEIERVGSGVSGFKPGDLIYMRVGHRSHQVIAADQCSLIPKGIDLKEACWAGLAKTAFRAAWAARFEAGQTILVIGAGPVGQMVIRWAVASEVDTIAVADLAPERLVHAERGGATCVFSTSVSTYLDEIGALDGGKGPSVVIDVTGNSAVFSEALAAVAKYGKVILLGDTGFPSKQCLTSDVMVKGLTIQATHDSHDRDGWTQRKVDELFFDHVAKGTFNLSGLITHEFLPEDCQAAYALASGQREQAMGILYDWEKAGFS